MSHYICVAWIYLQAIQNGAIYNGAYRGAKMWNELPEKTKQVSSLYCFKKTFSFFSLFL